MKKLSISIMMHPSREKYRAYFQEQLGADIPIALDNSCGLIENMKAAWRLHDPLAQYHLVLNDDAILCGGFRERVEGILGDQGMAYCLYFGIRANFREKIRQIYEQKQSCIIRPWLHFGIATILPVPVIPAVLEYLETTACNVGLPPNRNADTRIARFISSKGMKVYYPIPSLVDHRDHDESLVNDRGRGRVAQYFIDREVPA